LASTLEPLQPRCYTRSVSRGSIHCMAWIAQSGSSFLGTGNGSWSGLLPDPDNSHDPAFGLVHVLTSEVNGVAGNRESPVDPVWDSPDNTSRDSEGRTRELFGPIRAVADEIWRKSHQDDGVGTAQAVLRNQETERGSLLPTRIRWSGWLRGEVSGVSEASVRVFALYDHAEGPTSRECHLPGGLSRAPELRG